MSLVITLHERAPAEFATEMAKFLDGCLEPVVADLKRQYTDHKVEEVICDGVAAHFGILGDDQNSASDDELTVRLRRTVFGFQAFYRLMDLRASARVHARMGWVLGQAVRSGGESTGTRLFRFRGIWLLVWWCRGIEGRRHRCLHMTSLSDRLDAPARRLRP